MTQEISIIVAFSVYDFGIGVNNQLPWAPQKIKADLKRFKQMTENHAVIMGRRTWHSLPQKPLANRFNVVLSKNLSEIDGDVVIARSFNEAISLCKGYDKIFVIGGSDVYNTALNSNLIDFIYTTEIYGEFESDTFFKSLEHTKVEALEFSEIETDSEGFSYRFVKYKYIK